MDPFQGGRGLKVSSLGFRGEGFALEVKGRMFGVQFSGQKLRFRAKGLGFRVKD